MCNGYCFRAVELAELEERIKKLERPTRAIELLDATENVDKYKHTLSASERSLLLDVVSFIAKNGQPGLSSDFYNKFIRDNTEMPREEDNA